MEQEFPNEYEGLEDDDLAGLGLGEAEAPLEQEARDEVEEEGEEEDEQALAHIPEAEEGVPAGRSEREQHNELVQSVQLLIGKMELAIQEDQGLLLEGKPATKKLNVLDEMEEMVSRIKAHQILIKSGFVGLLKGFLEPLQTSKTNAAGEPLLTLPHVTVRQGVYRALKRLPIKTEEQEGREILKSAEIGPVLRFYAAVKHETQENRRVVSELLKGWMHPIVEEGRKALRGPAIEAAQRDDALRELKRRRQHEFAKDQRQTEQMKKQYEGKKVGEAGYRYHAHVPRAAQPNFVVAPTVPEHVRALAKEKAPQGGKKLRKLEKEVLLRKRNLMKKK